MSGLPGNPVSTMIAFDLFVAPALRRLFSTADSQHSRDVLARLGRNVASHTGPRTLCRCDWSARWRAVG
jgi:molybdopterin molybdotransferase